MRYTQAISGDWIQPKDGYRVACCDCGLVHNFNFRIKNGKVQIQPIVNTRATAAKRRNPRFKIPIWERTK